MTSTPTPTKDGEISRKRSYTLVRTLREEYGPDFAKGYRSDATLGTVLKKEGAESLRELLRKKKATGVSSGRENQNERLGHCWVAVLDCGEGFGDCIPDRTGGPRE